MTEPRIVREARIEDAEAFVRAHEAAWDASLAPILGRRLGELAPFDARVASFRAGVEEFSPNAKGWVAERDGEIVGLAVYARDSGTTGELRDLYVVPDAWGTGVAQALLGVALDAMRENGLAEAVLWVGEANSRARRFYEREGWSGDGATRRSTLGPTELRYRRRLT
jgi:GNAT superfamily N-acetyltransferase